MSMYCEHFDANQVTFADPIKNRSGHVSVCLNYSTRKRLVMRTPSLRAPFGVSVYKPAASGPSRLLIDLSLDDKNFLKNFETIDRVMIDAGVKNSELWFGKVMTRETVETLYHKLVKPSRDPEKYAPMFKAKIRTGFGDKVQVNVFNVDDKKAMTADEIVPGSHVRATIELAPVWFVNKQFGVTFNVARLEVQHAKRDVHSFAFQD